MRKPTPLHGLFPMWGKAWGTLWKKLISPLVSMPMNPWGAAKIRVFSGLERSENVQGSSPLRESKLIIPNRIVVFRRHNFDAIHAFAATLDTTQIDSLVLNAGVQSYDVSARTEQGFERTFGINHLAHYLLARFLLPQMKDGVILVFTASGTHNPAEKHPIPPPNHANAEWLAYPARDPHLDRRPMMAALRAYSSSKLCNVMTARTLATRPEVLSRGLRVFAYDPGLTPGTGLVQSAPFVVRRLIWPFFSLIQPFSGCMNSLVNAGRGLADLSDGTVSSKTAIYCSLRKGKPTWPSPSTVVQDDAACASLWRDSATMVGLPA